MTPKIRPLRLKLPRTDFSYLQRSSPAVQLTAAVYEYARASEPLRALMAKLEADGVYDTDESPLNPTIEQSLNDIAGQASSAFTMEQIYWMGMWLGKDLSFYQLRKKRLCPQLVGVAMFTAGIRQVCRSTVTMLVELWRNDPESTEYSGSVALAIPWEYTDDELATQFRELLPS